MTAHPSKTETGDVLLRGEKITRPLSTSTKKAREKAETTVTDDRAKRPAILPPLSKKTPSPEPA